MVLWTLVRAPRRKSHDPQSRSCRASTPIRRSCGSARIIISRPRPSNGSPASRSTIRAISRHWRLVTRPLRRASQLDMRGDPDSCGIWAPGPQLGRRALPPHLYRREALRPDHRRRRLGRLVARLPQLSGHRPTIDGDWSDPIHLNSSGFDPSLFHDEDGRRWLLNMLWDHRPGRNRFAGIVAPGI